MGLVAGELGEQEEKVFDCTYWVRTRKWASEKVRKPSPTESPLLFDIHPELIPQMLTALGKAMILAADGERAKRP